MKLIIVVVTVLAMIVEVFSLPVFNGKCTLKNKYYDEYFYAADIKSDEKRRHVFTWIPDKVVSKESYWSIEPEYGGTFTIKNWKNDEYLYPNYNADSGKRPVYTWIPLPREKFAETSWKIEPVENNSAFTIKNVVYKDFLYASDSKYNENRRSIYTGSSKDSSSYWIITCDTSEGMCEISRISDEQ